MRQCSGDVAQRVGPQGYWEEEGRGGVGAHCRALPPA